MATVYDTLNCAHCGKEFTPKNTQQIYCSPACNHRVQKARERIAAARPVEFELGTHSHYEPKRTDGKLDPDFVAWFKAEVIEMNKDKGEGAR